MLIHWRVLNNHWENHNLSCQIIVNTTQGSTLLLCDKLYQPCVNTNKVTLRILWRFKDWSKCRKEEDQFYNYEESHKTELIYFSRKKTEDRSRRDGSGICPNRCDFMLLSKAILWDWGRFTATLVLCTLWWLIRPILEPQTIPQGIEFIVMYPR